MWIVVLAVVVAGAGAVLLAARRAQHEFEPTIRAFDDFRAALRPAVADLRRATVATRARLERRESGRGGSAGVT